METVLRKGVEYLAQMRKRKLVPIEFINYRTAKTKAEELGPEWLPVLKSQYATYADLSLPESQRSGCARVARAHNSEKILAAQGIVEAKTLDELLHLHGYPSLSQLYERNRDEESMLIRLTTTISSIGEKCPLTTD